MKKHIVTLAGGIGNQMLQYALFIYLKSHNFNCFLYKKPDYMNDNHGFDIDYIFNTITIDKKNRVEINYYIQLQHYLIKIERFISKFLGIQNRSFIARALPIKVITFPTWENYTFLNNMEDILNKTYKFPDFVSDKNLQTSSLMLNSNSVSIHVRRGDYITNPNWRSLLGDICDLDYYSTAINIVCTKVEDPCYFIFSDDINWVKQNLILKNCFFIDWNSGNDSYMDMQLMATCKHNIIANSTFSLMSAWLNKNTDKIVIGPSKWRNSYKDNSAAKFMEKSWQIITINKPHISLVCNFKLSAEDLINVVNQTFTDFEILSLSFNEDLKIDDRFKNVSSNAVNGCHIFEIKTESVKNFSNRKHLEDLLLKSYI
jgi:hypothetical protein